MKNFPVYNTFKQQTIELGLEEYGTNVDVFLDDQSGVLSGDLLDGLLKKFAEEGFHLDVVVNSLWSHFEND